MSDTPTRPDAGAQPRMERLQRWIAALASVLLHAAFLAILLYAAKMTVTPPQGASSGGRVRVNFVGESGQPEPTPPAPPSPMPPQEARPRWRFGAGPASAACSILAIRKCRPSAMPAR